jgi:hypothetical protein
LVIDAFQNLKLFGVGQPSNMVANGRGR